MKYFDSIWFDFQKFDCGKRLTENGGRREQVAETMTITKRICGRVKCGNHITGQLNTNLKTT